MVIINDYNTFSLEKYEMTDDLNVEAIANQLCAEAKLRRINVSVARKNLIKYCEYQLKDAFVTGHKNQQDEYEKSKHYVLSHKLEIIHFSNK